jgi:hypothetical protein
MGMSGLVVLIVSLREQRLAALGQQMSVIVGISSD